MNMEDGAIKTILIEYILIFSIMSALFSISIAISFNIYPFIAVLLPLLWIISEQKEKLYYIVFILFLTVLINIGYLLFVDYMNHPWFAGEDPFTCDGPCYGWYTFEKDIEAEIMTNIALLMTSSIITWFLKAFIKKRSDI